MDIPEKYKADHLFLLVGENPLPNYVAARLLWNPESNPKGAVYLVYTSGTKNRAEDLQTILIEEFQKTLFIEEQEAEKLIQLVPLNNNESNPSKIQEAVQDELEKIQSGKIGLHYTGGTKAMSVHSYRSLFYEKKKMDRRIYYEARPNVIFSYLDPRHLEMCIDREEGESDRIKVTPDLLQVTLDTIFKLHGWSKWRSKTVNYTSKLDETAKALAVVHCELDSANKWREWCRDSFRDEKGNWKKDKEKQPLNLDSLNDFSTIQEALSKLGITEKKSKFQDINFNSLGFKKLGHIYDWLDGTWLEHFVLWQVKELCNQFAIKDSASSIHIPNSNSSDKDKKDKFEIDVAFMRGYQLFAISCSTEIDLKKENSKILKLDYYKKKLFEAYIRARQLGGNEARVALVCCVSPEEADTLKTEITNVLNPEPESEQRDYKIEIFGREDLSNLSEKISAWIRNVDKEASKRDE